jgi:hypothetical protein
MATSLTAPLEPVPVLSPARRQAAANATQASRRSDQPVRQQWLAAIEKPASSASGALQSSERRERAGRDIMRHSSESTTGATLAEDCGSARAGRSHVRCWCEQRV